MINRKPTQTSQPSTNAQINWSSPLSLGLVAASIAEGSPSDLTPYSAPKGFTIAAGKEGREGYLTIASSQYWETTAANRISTFPFTVVSIIRPAALVQQAIFTVYSTATNYHELYLNNTGGIVLFSAPGGASATAASSYTVNETLTVGARISSATDRTIWKNGIQVASNTTSSSPSASANNRWGLWNGTTESFGGGMALRLVWNRALSDIEMAEIGQNPWQIFESLQPRIFASISGAYTLVANSGSYTYTGQTATLLRSKVITADQGSYSVSGQTSTILKSKVVSASFGSYSISGQTATILKSKVINAAQGSYTYTGQTASIVWTGSGTNYTLVADKGDYTYTGQSATITYTGSGVNYTLTADVGNYTYTGQAAIIQKSKVLNASTGTYNVAGQAATLAYSGSNIVTLKAGSWIRYRTI